MVGPEVNICDDGPRKSSNRELGGPEEILSEAGAIFCLECKEEFPHVGDANGNRDSKKCTSQQIKNCWYQDHKDITLFFFS